MDFNNTRGDRSSMRGPPASFDSSFPNPSLPFRRSATFSQPMQHNPPLQPQSSDDYERAHTRTSSDWSHVMSQSDLNSRGTPQYSSSQMPLAPRTLEEKIQELRNIQQRALQQETDLHLLQQKQKQSEEEVAQMISGYQAMHPQSEPTTPPEYHDPGFPTALSRPNRFSASMIGTVPAIGSNRPSRAGSQLTSPPAGLVSNMNKNSSSNINRLTWKSVPGSRRNSDEEDEVDVLEDQWLDHRAAANKNRNSMPVTGLTHRATDRFGMPRDQSYKPHVNTAQYLFGDDDRDSSKDPGLLASPEDVSSYLQMNATDDKFPILVRQGDKSGKLSASSAALDLALGGSAANQSALQDVWSSYGRRLSSPQKPLSHNFSSPPASSTQRGTNGSSADRSSFSSSKDNNLARRSMGSDFGGSYFDRDQSNAAALASLTGNQVTPPRLTSSYSTNDIPTVKTQRRSLIGFGSSANSHAEQHLQNHNASIGRVPPNGASARQSREFSGSDVSRLSREIQGSSPLASATSNLKANAAPFGPSVTSPISMDSDGLAMGGARSDQYPGYSYQQSMQDQIGQSSDFMPLAQQNQFQVFNNQQQTAPGQVNPPFYNPRAYAGQNFQNYNPYSNMGASYGLSYIPALANSSAVPRPQGISYQTPSQRREPPIVAQRRREELEAQRAATVPIEQCRGQIFSMARDQHGCRYLQRKLEERKPEYVRMIFDEVYQGVVELMTDPFGNYLCQKLLEYADDDQRTALIATAAPQLVRIAINQHGTRALQRMIDFLSTPKQVAIVTDALKNDVVNLIKDLNGNHVIQKCLNRMSSDDAQFIFDNVSKYIVTIGTHRHGCCVIQRCLDHSTLTQKKQIVETVTINSFALNEDPFGNYVTQYILDLREPEFVEPMIEKFRSHIVPFSKHKFSSNVIEKCLRVGQDMTKRWIIEEIMQPNELESMARDQYANYVVQTAMDRVDEDLEKTLFNRIRSVIPSIRTTPHGRRILSKLQTHDQRIAEGRPHPYRRRLTGRTQGDTMLPGSQPVSNPGSQPVSQTTSQSVSRTASRPVSSHGFNNLEGQVPSQSILAPRQADNPAYPPSDAPVAGLDALSRLTISGKTQQNNMGGLPNLAKQNNHEVLSLSNQFGRPWAGGNQLNHQAAPPASEAQVHQAPFVPQNFQNLPPNYIRDTQNANDQPSGYNFI